MDQIFELLAITLGAILANNFIFSQFLGICPFLGVSKKVDTAVGMGLAVTFVMGLASAVCFVVNNYVLIPLGLGYMQTVAFILVIASLVQFIEMFLQAFVPALAESLGVFIPLIVVNCIILGRAEGFSYKNGVVASFFDGIFQGIGYTLVLLAMCIIREFLGAGTFGGGILGEAGKGIQILPSQYAAGMMTLPVGGFLTLAVLIATMQWALSKSKK